jgi:hypothetical protein
MTYELNFEDQELTLMPGHISFLSPSAYVWVEKLVHSSPPRRVWPQ